MIVAGLGGGEGVRLVLESEEAMLLSELADQVDSVLLLGEPSDPALGRLLPSAYPDDAEASAEFSRYTRESLVDGKRQAAQRVRDATAVQGDGIVQIELDQSEAWGWLTFLTDLRLILAERVGAAGDDADDEPGDLAAVDDESGAAASETRDDYLRAAYEWAGFVQGSMLEVLDPTDR
ncbi:DUF2017 family protein [Agromyces sp. H3Y2-19a]|uniref:DUF2017 family protein n=1 Tax=Agromyces TaxID=33877 RepID=UPI001E2B0518|nr:MULTISPECIES: DUF2017 family protein [Agromyces]MCD5345599.1 DUF2017 domain-containing protein [Agromyces sp. S2-1-8]MDF0515493.1 DUF2017 family protein [Agromyces chromiiresistens]